MSFTASKGPLGTMTSFLVLSILLVLCNQSRAQESKVEVKPSNGTKPILFNGTDVSMRLSGPLRVNIYAIDEGPKMGKLLEKVDIVTEEVPTVKTSLAPGENGTLIASISVNYTKINCPGLINNKSLITEASFAIDFSLDKIKWSLVKISTSLAGNIAGNKSIPLSGDFQLRPYIKSGYTPSPADRAYTRSYTTGSPSKRLSWYCNGQEFLGSLSNGSEFLLSLQFPGLLMQPFDNTTNPNGTYAKFGYSWDCDPLISAKIWEILFIVLILVSIFLWSVQMMLSLNTPSRFDDPKGKPLSVPLHE